MRLVLALFTLMLAGAGAVPASAQPKGGCADMSNLPQQEMNLCARALYDVADGDLNAVWADLRARDGEGHDWALILAAQRAWLPFRDAHCEAVSAPYEGGSIQPLILFSCLQDVTQQRTAQLRDFLQEP